MIGGFFVLGCECPLSAEPRLKPNSADNTVSLDRVTVGENQAEKGASVHHQGTLTVTDSTSKGNVASFGGAFYNELDGKLTVNGG